MLRVHFLKIHEDKVDRLRWWLRELTRRKDETLATFENEGTWHEVAYLVRTGEGPLLIYAVECEDLDKAGRAFAESTLPIDAEHKQILREVVDEPANVELLYELTRR